MVSRLNFEWLSWKTYGQSLKLQKLVLPRLTRGCILTFKNPYETAEEMLLTKLERAVRFYHVKIT